MKDRRRKIACMTATRADYPRIKSVLKEIKSRPNLELQLIVTGTHLMPEFGNSIDEIIDDGFRINEKFEIYDGDDSPYGMAKAASKCSNLMANALNHLKPDIVIITVDRIETLAAAMSTAYMNYPIAHVQGGEVTGTIDESIRHSVTKLSHIHFPSNEDAALRIINMGEDPDKVFTFGCPYIDIIKQASLLSKNELCSKYNLDKRKEIFLFTQHPVTTEYGHGLDQVKETIDALLNYPDKEIVVIYSNKDAGGQEIIRYLENFNQFHIFPNIDSNDFLSLMRHSQLMIGNSSAGIREAPSFKLPVVNIGTRQNGRLRALNVIDTGHNKLEISEAIERALNDSTFRNNLKHLINPYGEGNAAKRIVDVLEEIDINNKLLQKIIRY